MRASCTCILQSARVVKSRISHTSVLPFLHVLAFLFLNFGDEFSSANQAVTNSARSRQYLLSRFPSPVPEGLLKSASYEGYVNASSVESSTNKWTNLLLVVLGRSSELCVFL